ncbi:hypothetical protein K469DRAFT_644251 [Zopfia rhizophila CBS 207.26]|uniref:Uncharacterized protein n=1 Tax=Zopfia rhizophila CBS 207.26 TaxID=1314779 RepID=A0A6A6DGS9_9PEZI|nr:hypothetical protein K469DRAFT_644251 [Zopfia rhizophila CBS 207.26]
MLQTLEGHSNWVNIVAFSPDGKVLVLVSRDKTAKLWDTSTGAVLQMPEVNTVQTLSFSADRTFTQTDREVDVLSRSSYLPGIFVREQWVCSGIKYMLWLPSEYQLCCTAVYGSVVALGHSCGRVLILEFALLL